MSSSMYKLGPTPWSPNHGVIITATALHLLRRRIINLGFKKLDYLENDIAGFKDLWVNYTLNHVLSKAAASPYCCLLSFFNGKQTPASDNSTNTNSPGTRNMTNILLAANVLVYIAQFASQGKLLLWGAKVNSLVDQGQLWRLLTSSFLHANVGHLLVNCYSLNSIGPTMESFSGPKRFVAVYFASAIASSVMSYRLCTAPSVGASGAIFGLVGSVAVFVIRHQGLVGGGKEELKHLAQVIILNMVIGLMSKGIDNWGHLGGLLGGVVTSYLVGPAWKYKSLSDDGRRVFTDKAPIKYLFNRKKKPPSGLN